MASSAATEELQSLASKCGLGTKGTRALLQWTCWLSYAATQARDPHIRHVPGWDIILPIDTAHAQEHLYQLLLRAGESRQVALATAMQCYPGAGSQCMESPLPKPLQGFPQGMSAFTTLDLPCHAIPYESLPTWARENALYAADLTARSLSGLTALAGLDLRFLNLYCADLDGLDLQHCDFLHTDMRGTHIRGTNIDRAVMDSSIGSRVNGKLIRSYAPASPADTRRGNAVLREDKVDFFHDREILDIFPVQRIDSVGGVIIGYLEDGRSVIQQQGRFACPAGVSAMLSADHGGKINTDRPWRHSPADPDQVLRHLEGATDYIPVTSRPGTVEALAEQLDKHGPAVVSVNCEIGNHLVIVDAIDLKAHTVALRDPYHGWAILVPLIAFTSRWVAGTDGSIVQLSAHTAQASLPPSAWA
ncbi:pentapeptide repeat-containing protein [Bordetella genomosp. 11]|nr:pentapeptide repeat-containing protein [Bordetella genomosp. 11]